MNKELETRIKNSWNVCLRTLIEDNSEALYRKDYQDFKKMYLKELKLHLRISRQETFIKKIK